MTVFVLPTANGGPTLTMTGGFSGARYNPSQVPSDLTTGRLLPLRAPGKGVTEMTVEEVEILLIEDNPADVELIMRALKAGNLSNRVYVARDGAEGLDFLFARGSYGGRGDAQPPKVVLLDLKLPRVGGLEVLRQIKGDARTRSVPVVVLTSSNEEPDIERSYALGANSYIVKPVAFEAFVQAVSSAGVYWLLVNQPPS